MIVLILARARNGVIGRDGGLPWHLPADLKRFKALTMGRPMIMGRKTFDGFPAPLPGRRHIVLTRDRHWQAPGAEVAHDVAGALALAGAGAGEGAGEGEVFVIGGAEIFDLFRDLADRIALTEIDCDATGDTIVAPFAGWHEVDRERYPGSGDGPAYSFVTLVRQQKESPVKTG